MASAMRGSDGVDGDCRVTGPETDTTCGANAVHGAVGSVAQWRLEGVPRHSSPAGFSRVTRV